jgi:hypothetical protein
VRLLRVWADLHHSGTAGASVNRSGACRTGEGTVLQWALEEFTVDKAVEIFVLQESWLGLRALLNSVQRCALP